MPGFSLFFFYQSPDEKAPITRGFVFFQKIRTNASTTVGHDEPS